MRYRKKTVVIEAMQWLGDNRIRVAHFIANGGKIDMDAIAHVPGDAVLIDTLEGRMRADKGDWIIKGVKGEFYPCKPDIFAATYEPVEP